jgi:TolB-like protein
MGVEMGAAMRSGFSMLSAMAVLAFLASPSVHAQGAEAEEKHRILLLDLKAENIKPETVKLIDGILATQLSKLEEFNVVSNADMREMLALEADRTSAGCTDDEGCLAEMAGALGARFVLYGQVGALGESMVVNLNLRDTAAAGSVVRESIMAEKIEQIPAKLGPVLKGMVKEMFGKMPKEKPGTKVATSSTSTSTKSNSAGGGSADGDATADYDPPGMGTFADFSVQALTGVCLGGVFGGILGAVPLAGPCIACAGPACAGGISTWVGDSLGKKRGAMIWPILGGCVGGGVTGLAMMAITQGASFNGLGAGALAGGVAGAVAGVVPAIVYTVAAEPKKPGDEGGFPGMFSPGHPETPKEGDGKKAESPNERPAIAQQMAY